MRSRRAADAWLPLAERCAVRSSLFLTNMETVGASGALFGVLGGFMGDFVQVRASPLLERAVD